MADQPFENSRLKIERAKYHIDSLSGQIDAYLETRPVTLVVRQNAEARQKTIGVKTNRPIPPAISLTLGDAVHNLRAALDMMAFDLVGGVAPRAESVQFPFAFKPESFESTFKNRHIDLAPKKAADAIRALKSYQGGNELLWALHMLDLSDKHKLIVPVARTATISANDLRASAPEIRVYGDGKFRFTNDKQPFFIINLAVNRQQRRALRDFEEEAKIQPAFTICFDRAQPFAHEPVISTMVAITNEVERAVASVAEALV